MKTKLLIGMAVLLASVTSCKGQMRETADSNSAKGAKKVLVVYFSHTGENYGVGNITVGNTAIVASFIKASTNGDSYELVPEKPYPTGYKACCDKAQQELDAKARPAFKNPMSKAEMAKYDVIFVGSPVWWGVPPLIVNTFYETYADVLATKQIYTFGTHEGSGASCCAELARHYFPKMNIPDALDVKGRDAKNAKGKVETWLKQLVLN